MNTLKESLRRLEHGRRLLNDVVDLEPSARNHVCSTAYCAPLNELDMIRMGVFHPRQRPVRTNVWMCRYKAYHVCDEKNCNLSQGGVCPISGVSYTRALEMSEYNAQDSRTHRLPREMRECGRPSQMIAQAPRVAPKLTQSGSNLFAPPAPVSQTPEMVAPEPPFATKRQRRQNAGKLGIKEARDRVEAVVSQLLFNNTLRKEALKAQHAHYEALKEKSWLEYAHECKCQNRVMNFIEQMIRDSNSLMRCPPFIKTDVKYDDSRHMYYVRVVIHVYKLACIHVPHVKLNIEALAMAVLDSMRRGMTVRGNVRVLPDDEYIREYLPPANNLPLFHYTKKKMFRGMTLLKQIYACALEDGASREDLQLESFSLPDMRHVHKPVAREWKMRNKSY